MKRYEVSGFGVMEYEEDVYKRQLFQQARESFREGDKEKALGLLLKAETFDQGCLLYTSKDLIRSFMVRKLIIWITIVLRKIGFFIWLYFYRMK